MQEPIRTFVSGLPDDPQTEFDAAEDRWAESQCREAEADPPVDRVSMALQGVQIALDDLERLDRADLETQKDLVRQLDQLLGSISGRLN